MSTSGIVVRPGALPIASIYFCALERIDVHFVILFNFGLLEFFSIPLLTIWFSDLVLFDSWITSTILACHSNMSCTLNIHTDVCVGVCMCMLDACTCPMFAQCSHCWFVLVNRAVVLDRAVVLATNK